MLICACSWQASPLTPPASERWKQLAQKKMMEVDEVIAHAQQKKQVLQKLLQCGCLRLEECLEADEDESSFLVPLDEKD
ncbi:hypothetical protein KSZ_07100 [Dictyobacter formicarum]|uniref:Uncharacterized protein n=1 Tax=Dictyobacter formicarum TaxID=2778368 RepID=A0ABQ3VAB1_9CHLR|nr:hypothetical protein KSZ_07100 [Dictyobacter formicarum]